nr:3'-5' exonuclease [Pontibacter sp. 172403-2]
MLFIDTETTGIPRDWAAPYERDEDWPHSVQVAWAVYTKHGQLVKTENHYVRNDGFIISESAEKIHGISNDFLEQHGENRKEIFECLAADLRKYQPLVVGHFMQLDYHMAGVGFFRSGLENPLTELPTFCTMNASAAFLLHSHQNYLRLGELYDRLFGQPLQNQHNALDDAQATARCFFELVRRGDIDERTIAREQKPPGQKKEIRQKRNYGCGLAVLFIFVLFTLISFWL